MAQDQETGDFEPHDDQNREDVKENNGSDNTVIEVSGDCVFLLASYQAIQNQGIDRGDVVVLVTI